MKCASPYLAGKSAAAHASGVGHEQAAQYRQPLEHDRQLLKMSHDEFALLIDGPLAAEGAPFPGGRGFRAEYKYNYNDRTKTRMLTLAYSMTDGAF